MPGAARPAQSPQGSIGKLQAMINNQFPGEISGIHPRVLLAGGWREGWPVVAAHAAAGLVAGGPGLPEPAVAARKDVTFWKRFMPPLPRLLGGLFAGLLMVHLSIPNQVVSSNELICSSVLDLQCGLAHRRGNAGGRSQ